MQSKIINIYEKYLDRIWKDLSKDDQIRLEGHFNGIVNEIDKCLEEEPIGVVLKRRRNEPN